MSDLIEDQILDDLKRSSFFALMFDETTDCSIVEQLVIHTRFIDPDGAVKAKFLKILDALKPAECDEDSSSNDHIVSLNATNIASRVKDYNYCIQAFDVFKVGWLHNRWGFGND